VISAKAQFTPRGALGRFIPAVITPAVVASVQAAVDSIQQTAQLYCPVDTGALRDSITTEVNETGSTVVGKVGPHMPYADYVEYGTGQRGDPSAPYAHVEDKKGQVAQPYMRPALDESKGAILDLFKSNISTAIG
jgi:HK97 gp10 family phage protein